MSPTSNTWESQEISYSSVIYDSQDNLYKLWYSGKTNNKQSIGYAISIDGINWQKYENNPVLTAKTDEPNHIYTPFVLKDSDTYKMWFTNSPDNETNFRIGYAESNDGINWNNVRFNSLVPDLALGELAVVSPVVLKLDTNDYRIWFIHNIGQGWKVAYATSTDGINWTKHQNNPVLQKTEQWEGNDVAKFVVIKDNDFFHAWYDSNPPSSISYAYSSDGINWIKPAQYNPVLTPSGIGGFNTYRIIAPHILKDSFGYKLYFTGFTNDPGNPWKIGVATNYTIVPTSTPTPTPSPQPTAIPTPTPKIVHSKKIIIIPGLGGSWNLEDIVYCKSNSNNREWNMSLLAQPIYAPLLTMLTSEGYTPIFYGYDWRKDVRTHISDLQNLINQSLNNNEQLAIVSHSLGGLIGRAYLEQTKDSSNVFKYLSIGTPHKGTPQAYPFWSAGNFSKFDWTWKIAASLALKACKVTHGGNDKQIVQQYFSVAQNLLPTFNYLRDQKSALFLDWQQMINTNNFLTSNFSHPYYGTTLGSIVGTHQKTISGYKVKSPNQNQLKQRIWQDGYVTGKLWSNTGDGTILTDSASIPFSRQTLLSMNHTNIVNSQTGLQAILSFLSDSQRLPSNQAITELEPQTTTIIVGYPATFSISYEDSSITDQGGVIILKNPKKAVQTLKITPKSDSTVFYVGKINKLGNIHWSHHVFAGKKNIEKRIDIDPEAISEPLTE